jgi:DNA-binding transcriptional MerR regulator
MIVHPAEELLTTASAARIADVVPDTLRLWQRLGKIQPAFVTPTRIHLYRRADVERVVSERAVRRALALSAAHGRGGV